MNDGMKMTVKILPTVMIVRKPYRAAALFAHLHRQLRCRDGSLPCCVIYFLNSYYVELHFASLVVVLESS